jgi:methylenetetrahydrofolate reductase (NADPH)
MPAPAPAGITGYPKSHPSIDDDITVQAMRDTRSHATYIISNLCFDPATISSWVRRVRRRGVPLPIQKGIAPIQKGIAPIQKGVAGPLERTELRSMATTFGIGQSTAFLTDQAPWFARMCVSGYVPELPLSRVAKEFGPEHAVAARHVFTLNKVAETEVWRRTPLAVYR